MGRHPGGATGDGADAAPRPDRAVMLKRVLLAAATAFLAVNIWTGAPLLALWVGSQVVGTTVLSMTAVGVVVVVLAVLVFALAIALAWLNDTYDRLTGRPRRDAHLPWMRAMGEEEEDTEIIGLQTSALERIIVLTVYVAVIALVAWFFLFAGRPLPGL
jgi:hypothetical protein